MQLISALNISHFTFKDYFLIDSITGDYLAVDTYSQIHGKERTLSFLQKKSSFLLKC